MDGIDAEPSEGEEDNAFAKKYIVPFADAEEIERESVEALLKTRIGKITTSDKDAIEELLEDTFKELMQEDYSFKSYEYFKSMLANIVNLVKTFVARNK